MTNFHAVFERLIRPFKRRILLMLGRAVIRLIDDTTKLQALQVEALEGETLDGIERIQEYGFTSHPREGAEAVVASMGGMRQHSVVIAVDDRRYRLTELEEGEVALYTDEDEDDDFCRVHLKRDREIELRSGDETRAELTPERITLETNDDVSAILTESQNDNQNQ